MFPKLQETMFKEVKYENKVSIENIYKDSENIKKKQIETLQLKN